MTGKPWPGLRTLELRALALAGATAADLGRHFNISRDAARGKARRLGLTLTYAPNHTRRPKPTSSYIDHHERESGACLHSWREHTDLALRWRYGDTIAQDIAAGRDLATRIDVERWNALGRRAEAVA